MAPLVGRFELEIISTPTNFAVFAELRQPIAEDTDTMKARILDAAKDELSKLAGDHKVDFKPGKIEVLDPANEIWPEPIVSAEFPGLLIWGVFRLSSR